jgi:hypothetical protein
MAEPWSFADRPLHELLDLEAAPASRAAAPSASPRVTPPRTASPPVSDVNPNDAPLWQQQGKLEQFGTASGPTPQPPLRAQAPASPAIPKAQDTIMDALVEKGLTRAEATAVATDIGRDWSTGFQATVRAFMGKGMTQGEATKAARNLLVTAGKK